MGKALEPALGTKEASHPTPESGKGRKEDQSFGQPMPTFPNQLLVAQVAKGLRNPLPQWGITAGRSDGVILLYLQERWNKQTTLGMPATMGKREQELQRFSAWTEASGVTAREDGDGLQLPDEKTGAGQIYTALQDTFNDGRAGCQCRCQLGATATASCRLRCLEDWSCSGLFPWHRHLVMGREGAGGVCWPLKAALRVSVPPR